MQKYLLLFIITSFPIMSMKEYYNYLYDLVDANTPKLPVQINSNDEDWLIEQSDNYLLSEEENNSIVDKNEETESLCGLNEPKELDDSYCYFFIYNLEDTQTEDFFIEPKMFFKEKYEKSLKSKRKDFKKATKTKNKKLSKVYCNFLTDKKINKEKHKNIKVCSSQVKKPEKQINHRQLNNSDFISKKNQKIIKDIKCKKNKKKNNNYENTGIVEFFVYCNIFLVNL